MGLRQPAPAIDEAIDTLRWLQSQIDQQTDEWLARKLRKIAPELGWPVYLVPVDEVAHYSATGRDTDRAVDRGRGGSGAPPRRPYPTRASPSDTFPELGHQPSDP
jgi:hypothetical protein